MPFVNVRLIEGVFTPEQKRDMIHRLTETMVEIEGENLRPVTIPGRGRSVDRGRCGGRARLRAGV